MDIIVRSILGHVRESDESVTLFVDAEVEGTSARCRLRFPEHVAVPALKVIIEDGIRALRWRQDVVARPA